MTKKELISKVAEETNNSKKDITEIVEMTLETIKETVKAGEKVSILGFGNFEPKENKPRNMINPATKKPMKTKGTNTVKFKVGKAFKDSLN